MSIMHILLLLLVVVLIFGTKKLRNIGSDLGGAVSNFKKGLDGDDAEKAREEQLRADPPVTASSTASAPREHETTQPK